MDKIKLNTERQNNIESSIEAVMKANEDFSKITLLCMETLSTDIIPNPMLLNVVYEYRKFEIKNKFEIVVHYDIHASEMQYSEKFTIMLEKYEVVDFQVWTSEDIENTDLYKGSGIHVEKEFENHYYGIHSSMNGSYYVTVEKSKCTKVNEFQKMINDAVKAPKTKEQEKKYKKMIKKMIKLQRNQGF